MILTLFAVAVALGVAPQVTSAAHTDSIDVALYARVLKSADQRVFDTTLIATALGSDNVELRRVAARTVSQVALTHRAATLPVLRRLAHDGDASVADAALFGLGLVRDTASVDLVASVVRSGSEAESAAAWALGEIGRPAADTIRALLATSATGVTGTKSLRELLIAESKIRPLDITAVAPHLKSTDPEVRWAAAYAIARQRAASGVRALLDAPAPGPQFRAELARALTSRSAGDSLRDRAVARLRHLVIDANPHVRINALQSIATFGTVSRAAVLNGLHDHDANVRVAASQSAATAFDTSSVTWRAAWKSDTAYRVRASLLDGAASRGVVLAGDSLWRASSNWRLRSAALSAWSGSKDTIRVRTVAMSATHDTDPRVRVVAYGLLAASDTAHADSAVQRAIAVGRADPDSTVRNSLRERRRARRDTADNAARSIVDRPIAWYENAVRRVVIPSLGGHPPRAVMQTTRGRILITFDGVLAPLTVLNYVTLADSHFYDHLRFHRVVPGFVAQDGDPRGNGEGGPGYEIRDELTLLPYDRGAVGMALSGPDTGGSQYFLTLTPQPHLTGHYTVFGKVTAGLAAMDRLVEGDLIDSVRINW